MKIILILFSVILFSCSETHGDKRRKHDKIHLPITHVDSTPELKPVQQEAFDALNTLQTSTDEKNHLYSTFANVNHPFYPADTSFSITQSELSTFMQQFVSKHCQNMSKDMQDKLVKSSVLAQEEYTVLYCNDESANQNFKNGLPTSGTWVIPDVLGRRDVIIVW